MMFCSPKCRDKTFEHYDDDLDAMIVYGLMELNSDRILQDFERAFGGREKLLNFLRQNNLHGLKKTIFDLDWTNETLIEKYKVICLLSLPTLPFAIVPYGITKASFRTLQGSLEYLSFLVYFNGILNTHGSYLHYFLYKVSEQVCPGVVHDGMLVTLFGRLLEHSCMPNVGEVIVENKMVYYITKSIKAGEKLLQSRW